jgi:calcineurin-like phosphoesterase family protein
MSETFYISDTHFDHHNIIRFCNRPFTTPGIASDKENEVERMNQHLEEEWNKRVGPNDTVYHLGDVRWNNFDLHRLNGMKRLIIGNHDNERQLAQYFVDMDPYLELRRSFQGKTFILMHYPIESWNGKYHGVVHLHGHTHGTMDNRGLLRFDVGVDCWGMKPITLEEICALIPERKEQAEEARATRDREFKQLNERADNEVLKTTMV